MSKQKTFLTDEISDKVDKYAMSGLSLIPSIIAKEICDDHAHEIVDNAEFSKYCIYGYVRQNVGKYLLKNFDNPEKQSETNQLSIDGWKYIQSHYIVDVEGQRIAEHISKLTEEQLLNIENRMSKNITGLTNHRNELKRYREKKFNK